MNRLAIFVVTCFLALSSLVGIAVAADLPKETAPVESKAAVAQWPTIWKSLQSSATRHLRISDSYITGENDLPPEHLREGAFSRWDVKKIGARWIGKSYQARPCRVAADPSTPVTIKICKVQADVEFLLVAPDRIEGRIESLDGFSCEICGVPKARSGQWNDFVWVPSN